MSNKRFKKGDRVKCSHFLYREDDKYKEMIGIFNHYNKYGDDIAYINFGQSCESIESIGCLIESIKLLSGKNEQLVFNFMLEKG